ncbi:MAG TPA: class I SAM-dependent methyltransferase [Sumerlaeia bacterium]|nr:class I SAM-dependent methyltransferase [Sumerlaeia bacterium]
MSQSLAFDKSQRLSLSKEVIERLFPADPRAPLRRVLDVGGYPGILSEMLRGKAEVITVDREVCRIEGYVKGSGCALPLADGCFEAAIADDVLEHIPPEKRNDFVGEMARVSRGWILIGGPFHSEAVRECEVLLNETTRLVTGKTNPWLDEHLGHGLPDLAETREALEKRGLHTAAAPNVSLRDWAVLKHTELLLDALPDCFADFAEVNRLYADHASDSDHRPPTYRHLILAHRDQSQASRAAQRLSARCAQAGPPAIAGLEFFGPGEHVPPPPEVDSRRTVALCGLFQKMAAAMAKRARNHDSLANDYVDRLERIVEGQERDRTRLEEEVAELRRRLKPYETSRLVRLWRRLRWR